MPNFEDDARDSVEESEIVQDGVSMMKALFNDLTRALLSSAIFLDDIHMNLRPESEFYEAWWLANEQLKRAIEFFLELKSYFFRVLDEP
jgi:hypothetical protein